MDKIVDETAPSGESKAHTAAYASFDSNTASLLHAFQFITRGIQGLKDDLESELAPEAMSIARQVKQLGRVQDKEASNQKAGSARKRRLECLVGPEAKSR